MAAEDQVRLAALERRVDVLEHFIRVALTGGQHLDAYHADERAKLEREPA